MVLSPVPSQIHNLDAPRPGENITGKDRQTVSAQIQGLEVAAVVQGPRPHLEDSVGGH